MPVAMYSASQARVLAAARVKATHHISYADAFTIALAQELGGTVVTGDPEFKGVESVVPVMWL
jgi:ribonuclease VapC